MGIMQIVSIIQTKAVGYDEYFLSIKQVYGYMSYDEKVPIHTNAHEVYLLLLVSSFFSEFLCVYNFLEMYGFERNKFIYRNPLFGMRDLDKYMTWDGVGVEECT